MDVSFFNLNSSPHRFSPFFSFFFLPVCQSCLLETRKQTRTKERLRRRLHSQEEEERGRGGGRGRRGGGGGEGGEGGGDIDIGPFKLLSISGQLVNKTFKRVQYFIVNSFSSSHALEASKTCCVISP